MSIKLEVLEDIIHSASENALAGTLTDSARIELYKLALTVAAEEFHRVEKGANGTSIVKPDILILLQQIAIICEPDVDTDMLMEQMTNIMEAFDGEEDIHAG